ncbi:MAG: HupE/UreJ family protein [Neomegalonema sp.]|nr:HupE/UreJ family protein [Neomegalonema sp.]
MMGRVVGLLTIFIGLIVFAMFYKGAPSAYLSGFYWALTPNNFLFWFTFGLIGLFGAHLGGDNRWLAPVIAVLVGAIFFFLAARGTQINKEMALLTAPAILLLGFIVAYGGKPERWLLLGAVAIAGAVQGFAAGKVVGARIDNLYFLGGFSASLLLFILGGVILADLGDRGGRGASLRQRIGAGAAGIGLLMTLQQHFAWI